MALNPFEQLESLVPEPRQTFEDLVGILLEDCGLIDGRIKVFRGDAGVDCYAGSFAEGEQAGVYQCKFFTKPWGEPQKRQIRDSFQTANQQHRLREWFLCVPVRLTIEDVRWFDDWRSKESIPIEVIHGDRLTQMLESNAGARTRQRFRDWGVFTVRGGSPVIQARVHCVKLDPKTGQTFRLFVWIKNTGDRTAEDIRLRLAHSNTLCVATRHDQSLWEDIGSGRLNPRDLQAKRNLHSGEEIGVLQIPLVAATPFPFTITLEVWLRDQGSSRQFFRLEANQPQGGQTIDFHPGQTAVDSDADGGYVQSNLKLPQDGPLENLLLGIAQHDNTTEFGVVDLGPDPAATTMGIYRPHLGQAGPNWSMNRQTLDFVLNQLVVSGWLEPPERAGKSASYRLSDAAKAHHGFLRQVELFKERRAKEG